MEITEEVVQIESNWFSSERDVTRTDGIHLSHVIDYIEYTRKQRDSFGGKISQIGNNYAVAGFSWERVLSNIAESNPIELWDWMFGRALTEPVNPLIIRPGEQCLDAGECPRCNGTGYTPNENGEAFIHPDGAKPDCLGCGGCGRVLVYMTPDGYHIDDLVLEEWKHTSKSARSPIDGPKFSRWLNFQIPVYLKALGLDTCRLCVYFSRGDYTTGQPIFKKFTLTYTHQEIDEVWEMIAREACEMVRLGLVDKKGH